MDGGISSREAGESCFSSSSSSLDFEDEEEEEAFFLAWQIPESAYKEGVL
jgi:hypothetical protein